MRAEEIRGLRQRAGLMSRELAEAVGITAIHLSRLENGHQRVTRQMELAIRYICENRVRERVRHSDLGDKLVAIIEEIAVARAQAPE